MKTFTPGASDITRNWYVVDAEGQTLGRLASNVARILTGKHKPIYSPHIDCGDYVIIVNAGKVRVTGKKLDSEFFTRHSQYPGGFRQTYLREMLAKHPDRVLWEAIWKMLPKNRLRDHMIKKLKVYARPTHPHMAHKPEVLKFD